MAGADLTPGAERADIQALLHTGFGTLPQACYLVLRIADRGAAGRWLADAPVTTAAERHVSTALQIAVAAPGMAALGIEPSVISGFSAEFVSGMAGAESRSRRLGDVGASAPEAWRWGAGRVPHVLAILYARTDLANWRARIMTEAFRHGFEILEDMPTTSMDGHEPFGFTDGVSQPQLDWAGARRPGSAADLEYGNLISGGEFLLGYRNEYALYTDRPLLEAGASGAELLPVAADDPTRRDLGRNGTYLVFRELHQDVRGFWRFAASQRRDAAGAVALAEAMVGRRISGDPLIQATRSITGVAAEDIRRNGFVYDDDKDGLSCPFGAHVRRANPRTADMPGGRQGALARLVRMLGLFQPDLREDLIAASRFHRILRRGRPFGSFLPPEEAMRPAAANPGSGLHFICLNANISRQFEFIQNAWLTSAKFAGLSGESDPLLGNRVPHPPGEETDGFTRPQGNGAALRITGLPRFITVAGGGYFFLPGLRALRYMARVAEGR